MVHEATPTDFKGTKRFVVDQTSAGPLLPDVQYFGIEAPHASMGKFESKDAPGYTNVSVTLRSWVSSLHATFCSPLTRFRRKKLLKLWRQTGR